LNGLASPDEAAFYTSGKTSNEAAFLYQLFVRQFGTNNLPDCSNMCTNPLAPRWSRVSASARARPRSKIRAGGHDRGHRPEPGHQSPRMMTSLEHAKRNGAKMIAINR